ncbi:MAG: PadR family transcriptional regulator [Candidatus Bathyarchaeia archaeon]|jgi:DNA-binding PadR family transcriptional regulator
MHFEHENKVASKWLKEAQKGYIRIAVLILLSKKKYHGYEMMKAVEDRTEGVWRPTAGGLYPILQSLEKEGYIQGIWNNEKRKRKSYHITESGKLVLDCSLLKHTQITESLNLLFREYAQYVLAVEPNAVNIPQIKNPFSTFFDEDPKSRAETLELKRERINHMIKMLQHELETVTDSLAKLNSKKTNLKTDLNNETELES